MDSVALYPTRFAEPELLQDPSRRDIPVADRCPQPPVARLVHPYDHGPTCLSCVTAAVSRTQQLVGQLRLVARSLAVKSARREVRVNDEITGESLTSTRPVPGH